MKRDISHRNGGIILNCVSIEDILDSFQSNGQLMSSSQWQIFLSSSSLYVPFESVFPGDGKPGAKPIT